MMRRIRRLVAYAAATGLLVAGAVSVSMEVAHASFSLPCAGNSTDNYKCTLTGTYIWPVALSVQVTDTASTPTSENVTVSWTATGISCTNNNNGPQTEPAGADAGATPFTGALPLPAAATDGSCTVTVTMVSPGVSPVQIHPIQPLHRRARLHAQRHCHCHSDSYSHDQLHLTCRRSSGAPDQGLRRQVRER